MHSPKTRHELRGAVGATQRGPPSPLRSPQSAARSRATPRSSETTPSNSPKECDLPLRHSTSDSSLSRALERSISQVPATGSLGGPFYDVENAGGPKSSLVNKVAKLEQRHALMRAVSAPRFPSLRAEGPGPGAYSLDPRSAGCVGSSRSASTVGSAVFASGQLRVPLDSSSWLILRNRTSEPGAASLVADDRQRKRHFNGRLKGAFFKGSARVTGVYT